MAFSCIKPELRRCGISNRVMKQVTLKQLTLAMKQLNTQKLFTDWKVHIVKNCDRGLGYFKSRGHSFSLTRLDYSRNMTLKVTLIQIPPPPSPIFLKLHL